MTTTGSAVASPSSGPSAGTPVGNPSAVGAIGSSASVPVAWNFTVNGRPMTVSSASRWPNHGVFQPIVDANVAVELIDAPEPAIGPFCTARLAGPSTSASSISRELSSGATYTTPARK